MVFGLSPSQRPVWRTKLRANAFSRRTEPPNRVDVRIVCSTHNARVVRVGAGVWARREGSEREPNFFVKFQFCTLFAAPLLALSLHHPLALSNHVGVHRTNIPDVFGGRGSENESSGNAFREPHKDRARDPCGMQKSARIVCPAPHHPANTRGRFVWCTETWLRSGTSRVGGREGR